MNKVLILGATGMLGHAVASQLIDDDFKVTLTSRMGSKQYLPRGADALSFDAAVDEIENLALSKFNYVINCIGIVKSNIVDSSIQSRTAAVTVNSLFPHKLAKEAALFDTRIIQIATDCVFSGELGNYNENSAHDAHDIYGKTKSLGEVKSDSIMHLRVSTIGREQGRDSMLLEWVRQQPRSATVKGFTDHKWNGITTHAFAKIVRGIIFDDLFESGTHHIIPTGSSSKAELVSLIAETYGRTDLEIIPGASGIPVDRTLSTLHNQSNRNLWFSAGYRTIPTIAELLQEMTH